MYCFHSHGDHLVQAVSMHKYNDAPVQRALPVPPTSKETASDVNAFGYKALPITN